MPSSCSVPLCLDREGEGEGEGEEGGEDALVCEAIPAALVVGSATLRMVSSAVSMSLPCDQNDKCFAPTVTNVLVMGQNERETIFVSTVARPTMARSIHFHTTI